MAVFTQKPPALFVNYGLDFVNLLEIRPIGALNCQFTSRKHFAL